MAVSAASKPQPLVNHEWRRADSTRGEWLLDWQVDEGAAMDAPDKWLPRGSHRTKEYMPGTAAAFVLRSAFCWREGLV